MSFDVDKNLREKGFTRQPNGIIISADKDFMGACKALAAAENISLGAAIQRIAHDQPELHKNWLKNLQPVKRPARRE